MTTKTSTSFLDSRFTFTPDGQETLPGVYEASPVEIVAQFKSLDRAHIRRRSEEMDAPECRIDRNQANKILFQALVMERETHKRRARYQHRGALGDLGIDLLRALMAFGRKHGRIYPSYRMLAHMLRKDPATIVEAMKRLIKLGFVTKHRRSKKITTPQGQRRVQDSNAYEVHMPEGDLASIPLITSKTLSDSDNPRVSDRSEQDQNGKLAREAKEGRFWLPKPYKMPDGTVC